MSLWDQPGPCQAGAGYIVPQAPMLHSLRGSKNPVPGLGADCFSSTWAPSWRCQPIHPPACIWSAA